MRTLIRKFLQRYGYDIIKTDDRHAARNTREQTVAIGRFSIAMPGNNIQLRHYREFPDMNAQLARLAVIMASKYPGATVVDVGANVGDTIAVLKSAIDLPVIGVEGDEVSYSYLERNSRQFSNVKIVKTYLGEKQEARKAELAKAGWNTTIVPTDAGSQTLVFKTLDEVLAAENPGKQPVKLLKVDVEGFDTIVLRGATDTLSRHQPVLYFEYNRDNMQAIGEEGLPTLLSFADLGYDRIVFFDHRGRLLIATSLRNRDEITQLHNYAVGKGNLLGYYDIAVFHAGDSELAREFVRTEESFL